MRWNNFMGKYRGVAPRLSRQAGARTLYVVAMLLLLLPARSGEAGAAESRDQSPASQAVVTPQIGHADYVTTLAVSAEGIHLLSGSSDTTAKLWDVASGRLLRTFKGSANVGSVAFFPGGKRFVSAEWDSKIRVWDLASGGALMVIDASDPANPWDPIDSVAVSPDGSEIASGHATTVKLWDAQTGKLRRTLKGHFGHVRTVAYSPDGRSIASVSEDRTLRLWDARTGALLKALKGQPEFAIVAFSPDGKKLAVGGRHGFLLWDAATGNKIGEIEIDTDAANWSQIENLAFSPDGTTLASVEMGDGTLTLWNIAARRPALTIKAGTETHGLAFSPDGETVFSGQLDGSVKAWNAESGKLIRSFDGRADKVLSVAFAPDSATVAAASERFRERDVNTGLPQYAESLTVWDMSTGHPRFTVEQTSNAANGGETFVQGVTLVIFAPDGGELIWGAKNNGFKSINAASGATLRTFRGSPDVITSLAISPDGKQLLSGDVNFWLRLWDSAKSKPIKVFGTPPKKRFYEGAVGVASMAFSPDGKVAATGNEDFLVRVWTPKTGNMLRSLKGHSGEVSSIAYAGDGSRLLSGSDDRTLKLWDTSSGRLLETLEGHLDGVSAVAFDPSGDTILSASLDHTLKLWDASTGKPIRTLEGHLGAVRSAMFSPDGKRIVSGSDDGTVKIWNAANGEALATLIAQSGGEWLVITPEGFFDASEHGAELLSVVQGLKVFGTDQFYQALFRPDLVREKLAGDPNGLVKAAAAKLDLEKIVASGLAPRVTILAPNDGESQSAAEVTAEAEIADQGGGIGKVEWRVNGVTVGVDEPSATTGQPLRLKRSLALGPGENAIKVVAYNGSNLIASVPGIVRVAAQTAQGQAKSKLVVLAAGINDYADAKLQLSLAVPDAQSLADALGRAGKGLYDDVDVTLLKDKEVTREGLDAAFAAAAGKLKPGDVFAFFAAGHGKTVDGRYYFVPQDAQLTDLPSVVAQGIAQDQWQKWFASVPAQRSVILFDTCESGTLTADAAETKTLEQNAANGRLAQATGRTIMTASSGDEAAIEGYGGHGLFTYNLLDALGQADSDGDGRVDVAELAAYIYAEVTALSEKVFKQRQVPQVRIGANHAFARTLQVLPRPEARIEITSKPTHKVTNTTEFQIEPVFGARHIHKLEANTEVTEVNSDKGWALIAKDGKLLGYVAQGALAPLH
jgi:WD40 repeat protein/uncharacterized caspase-like protein